MTTPKQRGSLLNILGTNRSKYVSRAAAKLEAALHAFEVDPRGKICADFGSNVGGFVQVLLKHGATKVYAVEKGFGVLDWSLRQDPRVIALEKTDARKVVLPEKVDLISSDTGWTRLEQILPSIQRNLAPGGSAIILVKPHYEALPDELERGTAKSAALDIIEQRVLATVKEFGFVRVGAIESPIAGAKGGNLEWLWNVQRV